MIFKYTLKPIESSLGTYRKRFVTLLTQAARSPLSIGAIPAKIWAILKFFRPKHDSCLIFPSADMNFFAELASPEIFAELPPRRPPQIFFKYLKKIWKKFKNEKNLKIFEKNFFFKKSWNIEKNTPLQDFSIFSPISTIFSTFSIFSIFSLLPTVWAVPLWPRAS